MEPIAVNQVVLRREFQVRDHLDDAKVREYAAILDRLPPVEIARIDGALCLVAGFHRYAAAVSVRSETVNAIVTDADENAAYEMAVRSNAAHGVPLTTAEKRRAAEGLLLRFTERSNRWIADDIGVSDPTVGAVRRELESRAKILHVTYTYGRDGDRNRCRCEVCNPPAPTLFVEPDPEPAAAADPEPGELGALWDAPDDGDDTDEWDTADGEWPDEAEEPEAPLYRDATVFLPDAPVVAEPQRLPVEPAELPIAPVALDSDELAQRAEQGWVDTLYGSTTAINMVNKMGGFANMVQRWSPRHKENMLRRLREIKTTLQEWEAALERELQANG